MRGAAGASATAPILPPFEGAPSFEQDGALEAPLGCGCEVYPAPSEFDYAPAPSIASVSTVGRRGQPCERDGRNADHDPRQRAQPRDARLHRLRSAGRRGPRPNRKSASPAATRSRSRRRRWPNRRRRRASRASSIPFSIRTLAGETPQSTVQYAGVPRVSGVANSASKVTLKDISGARRQRRNADPPHRQGPARPGHDGALHRQSRARRRKARSFTLEASTDTHLDTQTVAQSPALASVQACTVSGCSTASKGARLLLYPPGQPAVESLTPPSGSAAGGTAVTVHGKNLGCPLSVAFGGVKGASFSVAESILACASTAAVDAVSPPEKSATTGTRNGDDPRELLQRQRRRTGRSAVHLHEPVALVAA